MYKLPFPCSQAPNETIIETEGPITIVGANGTGKTRLGAWLENTLVRESSPVLRISAQKSLTMPGDVSLRPADSAYAQWTRGTYWEQPLPDNANARMYHNLSGRWNGNAATGSLNDFTFLVEFLLSEDAESSRNYRDASMVTKQYIQAVETSLMKVKRIWEELLPHRKLVLTSNRIQASAIGGEPYKGSELSDGERVIFYLVASCVRAPVSATLLVDEPELHLHRLIQRRLWDAIQNERQDCLFVYFTHDLEFAASRSATQIALRGFDGTFWHWLEVPREEALPADLMLTLLGSRKPVLFTEGERSSLDADIYPYIYPDHTVVPLGSCETVIHTTVSFTKQQSFHHIDCKGLIDRDQRTDDERTALELNGVLSNEVSEAENLLLLEPVLRAVAIALHRDDDVDALVATVKAEVFARMQRDKELIVSALLRGAIEHGLVQINPRGKSASTIGKELGAMGETIERIASDFETRVDVIIEAQDYDAALSLYPNKGLSSDISKLFGFKSYKDEVVRLVKKPAGEEVRKALRESLPVL